MNRPVKVKKSASKRPMHAVLNWTCSTSVRSDIHESGFNSGLYPTLFKDKPWTKRKHFRNGKEYFKHGSFFYYCSLLDFCIQIFDVGLKCFLDTKINCADIIEVNYEPPKKKVKKKKYGPIGEDGEIRFPKIKTRYDIENERKKREIKEREKRKEETSGKNRFNCYDTFLYMFELYVKCLF